MASAASTQPAITLTAFYGCCLSDTDDDFCDCFCHDPSQGGTNVACCDADRPDVAAILGRIASTGRPWHGRVEWARTGPDAAAERRRAAAVMRTAAIYGYDQDR